MTKYRLETGDHMVSSPNYNQRGEVISEGVRIVTAPAEIESDSDLCAAFNTPGIRPKFSHLNEVAAVTGHVWNPAVETIEAFAERMRTRRSEPVPQAAPHESPPAPTDKELRDSVTAAARRGFQSATGIGGDTTNQASRLNDATLVIMPVEALREHCDQEEIPYDPGATREQLVQIVRAFQGTGGHAT